MGDSQHVKYAAMDVEREVLDTIVWTSATTIAGAVALLEFWSEIRKSSPRDLDDASTTLEAWCGPSQTTTTDTSPQTMRTSTPASTSRRSNAFLWLVAPQ